MFSLFTSERSRDSVPCCKVPVETVPDRCLGRPVRQRIQRRRAIALRTNAAIDSMNDILEPNSSHKFDLVDADDQGTERIHAAMKRFDPCSHLSDEAALRALLGSELGYDGQAGSTQTTAPFDRARVALPNLRASPCDFRDLLDKEATDVIVGWEKELVLSPTDYSRAIHSSGPQTPYMDPNFKKKPKEYLCFISEFVLQHILTFTDEALTTCGLFFVPKKGDKLRMILDARPANEKMKRPQHAHGGVKLVGWAPGARWGTLICGSV